MFKRNVKKGWAWLPLVAILCILLVPGVHAQDYLFNLAENRVDVYINEDGTAQIVYDLTFTPEPGSHPIDVVDVGLPNSTYRLQDVRASIDGVALNDISNSEYVSPGVAVWLGPMTIQPGETGTLHFEATVQDLIYQDSDDDEYASIEFAPTWFDSQFVQGPTRMEVNFHLPPGVGSEEPRYHEIPFTTAEFQDDRVVYTWVDEDARGDREYVFGASFPKQYLAEGVVQKPPAFNLNLGPLCSGLFGGPVCWIAGFGLIWAAISLIGARSKKKRRMEYLPPALAVEGSGIKRGLTAVEAAILLEAPLNKVVTMVLFGLVKKSIVTVESDKPLRVAAVDPVPEDKKLWYYERRFLQAVKPDGSMDQEELREMIIDLIGDVNKKLTGFSRKETKAYYQDIAARAWQQVEAADTPEVLGERWGNGLEWTMLDEDWDGRTRRTFQDRPVMLPRWWWGYRPWVVSSGHTAPSGGTVPSMPSGGGTPVTLPTLPGADFANTVVTGVEGAANTVVSSIDGFTSGVTQKTNPPPKSSSSGSRSGGYSCACACACAGCACACAGGGR